jgi:hypothetical protein
MNISLFQNSIGDTNARHLFAWLSTYKDYRYIIGKEEREKLHTGALMTVTLIIVSKTSHIGWQLERVMKQQS